MKSAAKSEDTLIAWLASHRIARDTGALIGIGDDMAMMPAARRGAAAGDAGVLLTTDMLMDGVHFDTAVHTPEQIGRKALAASLSDCAAMAVRPWCAVVSVALPDSWSMEQAQGLLVGMEALAQRYQCGIVGGDTNSWSRPLVVNVSVLARPWPDAPPARRCGMHPGDEVWVTGRLGGSQHTAGSTSRDNPPHHMSFEPRVAEAHWLAVQLGASLRAMMDLSDGLSMDAPRMAAASACGIEFDGAALAGVVSEAAKAASRRDGRSPLGHALHDGEDFELLFAVEAGAAARLEQAAAGSSAPDSTPPDDWTRIGTAIAQKGVWIRHANGRREAMKQGGWQHFKDRG